MLKLGYKYLWVPIMGRILSVFIVLLERKQPKKLPTYKIDGDNSGYNRK